MTLDEERERIKTWQTQMELRLGIHEERLNALQSVPATLEKIDRRLWEGEQTMFSLRTSLEMNTNITKSIHEAQITGRVLGNLWKWAIGVVLALGILIKVWKDLH